MFCGQILMDERAQKYSSVDIEKLPDSLRQKMKSYAYALMSIVGGIALVLIHARLWTLAITVLAIIWGVKRKSRIGEAIDRDIGPYLKGDGNGN